MGVPSINEFSCRPNINITDNTTLLTEINNNNCKNRITLKLVLNYCLPDFKKIQNSTVSFKDVVNSVGEGQILDVVRIRIIFEVLMHKLF
ncbi:hypothetical protein MXB_526 [Myxobolus squamalis]|nr:hypothetical protein MXB_526 [Myxobolus squamalis]